MKNREKPVFLSALAVAMTGVILQAQAGFYDLYSGMLTKKGDQLILAKCGITSADFILEFESKQLKEQLPDLTANRVVQFHVRANVQEKDGQHYLIVHDINGFTVGSSCNFL